MQSYGVHSQSQSLLGGVSHTELNVVIYEQIDHLEHKNYLNPQALRRTFLSEILGPM